MEQVKDEIQKNYKVILLGDTGVGKSSIIEKICSKESIVCHNDCNIEVGSKSISLTNLALKIQFFNMIESEKTDIFRLKRLTFPFYRDTALVILVIDLSQSTYIDTISRWIFEVEQNHNLFSKNFNILCLGTKGDRRRKDIFLNTLEPLGAQIASYSKKFKQNILYYEVSSKDCNSCSKLLDQIKILAENHIKNESLENTVIKSINTNIIKIK